MAADTWVRCLEWHRPGHHPWGDHQEQAGRQGQAFQKWQRAMEKDTSHQSCPLSTSEHPAQHLAGFDRSGHLAKGGQRKGTSHTSSARVVIELNESLFLAWAGIGSGCKEGTTPCDSSAQGASLHIHHSGSVQPARVDASISPLHQGCGCNAPGVLFWGCPFMSSSYQAWAATQCIPTPTTTAEHAKKKKKAAFLRHTCTASASL